jgi:hypothetical protein
MKPALFILLTGLGATATTDAWALLRQRLFGTPLPNYRFVGRWIAQFPRGRFRHEAIARAPVVRGELAVGWLAHYAIGIGFAALPLVLRGSGWIGNPELSIALLVGLATVVAPFLILQPAMGLGIAASRTPRPAAARLQSILTHALFGLGLYLSAIALGFSSRS